MNMFTCNQYSTVEHVSALNQPKASNLLKLVDLAGQKSFFTRYRLIELDAKLYTTVAELSSYTHVATCTPQASTLSLQEPILYLYVYKYSRCTFITVTAYWHRSAISAMAFPYTVHVRVQYSTVQYSTVYIMCMQYCNCSVVLWSINMGIAVNICGYCLPQS